MAEPCVIQLETACLSDDETCCSDDVDVSVANMNRNDEKLSEKIVDEKSCETENEVTDEEYNYSDESVCSEDTFEQSEITTRSNSPFNRTIDFSGDSRIEKISEGIHSQFRKTARKQTTRSSPTESRYGTATPFFPEKHLRRRNMSFTNAEMRRIEIENQHLLKKIMAQQKMQTKPKRRTHSAQPRVSSSAINRKKLQKRIEEENMILLRKIQGAKSCAVASKVIPGYRLTSF